MKVLRVIIVAALLAAAAFGSLFLTEYLDTKSEDGEAVVIEVPQGAAGKTVAKLLKENGLIRFEQTFLLRLRGSEYAGKLRTGAFELHKGMCIDDMIEELATGGSVADTVNITIPEGSSIEQMALRMEEYGLFSAEEFLDEADNGSFNYPFLDEIPDDSGIKHRLQGFLFPSTYNVYADATAHDVIDIMLREFEKQYASLGGKSGRSVYETVTLASLVEREAKLDSERATIAGVIENRLADGLRLQIDAAVIYAISDGLYDVDRVLYRDLEVDSPYNVYRNYGLPVGPICSPGLSSLEAAMNPEEHSYMYYHTDEAKGDGSHIFTESFSEHKDTMN